MLCFLIKIGDRGWATFIIQNFELNERGVKRPLCLRTNHSGLLHLCHCTRKSNGGSPLIDHFTKSTGTYVRTHAYYHSAPK